MVISKWGGCEVISKFGLEINCGGGGWWGLGVVLASHLLLPGQLSKLCLVSHLWPPLVLLQPPPA